MNIRHLTRLPNTVSTKIENHSTTFRLWFMYCNFSPYSSDASGYARDGSGIASHVWTLDELVGLLGTPESVSA